MDSNIMNYQQKRKKIRGKKHTEGFNVPRSCNGHVELNDCNGICLW